MMSETHPLRGINLHKFKPFYWFLGTPCMAGSSYHLCWSFVPISTISWSKNCVTLRGPRYRLRSLFCPVLLTVWPTLQQMVWNIELMVYWGNGGTLKWFQKLTWFTYSDFFKQKGNCAMAFALPPRNQNMVFTCCFVLGLSHSLSPLTSTTTRGTCWYHLCFTEEEYSPSKV